MMLTKLAHVLKCRALSTVQKIPKRKTTGQCQAGFRLPASTIDPGRLIFQSCTIRIGKGIYLYGLHFAGLTYSRLYGWLAWVELHLVNSKLDCQRLVCSCQKQSHSIQLKKETIYAFQVQATSASSNDHRHPSPPRFCLSASREALHWTFSNSSISLVNSTQLCMWTNVPYFRLKCLKFRFREWGRQSSPGRPGGSFLSQLASTVLPPLSTMNEVELSTQLKVWIQGSLQLDNI